MELLTSLGVSQESIHRRRAATIVSVTAHALAISMAILLPILGSSPLPETATGSLRLLLYDPPPPPPPPPPLGAGLLQRAPPAPTRPAEPEAAIEAPNPEMTVAPTPRALTPTI